MNNNLSVASIMVCAEPVYVNNRMIVSCCDAVWRPVENLPIEFNGYFTDEFGNKNVDYGGFLQMVNVDALKLIEKNSLYACFRCIDKNLIDYVQVCPPKLIYQGVQGNLKLIGWDIATGNGWLSASCHGCFPIDPFTGDALDENADKINKFGLFSSFDDCLVYCQKNNLQIPEHAPWYPVAICLDLSSFNRLVEKFKELN
jgi:hypothetical protein